MTFARALACGAALALCAPLQAQQRADEPALTKKDPAEAEFEKRLEETFDAVVRVRMRALDDARSSATLGRNREGTGVVIEPGWVLTIGYLVIEPDAIEVTGANRRTLPALLAGYDHASGFGLLRVQGDLGARPLPLGDSSALKARDPVIIAPFDARETASVAVVASRRAFTGSWEYLLEAAIFTTPPTMTWAGAALVDRDFKLVGVGSLLVRDSVEPGVPEPGNMFVPTDLLKPILAELKTTGRVSGPARPWLGLATEPIKGQLVVTRVSPDGPADRAGIKEGDVVVSVAGEPVRTHAELYRKMWSLGAAGVDVPIRLMDRGVDARDVKVKSIDRFQYFKEKKPL